MSNDDLEPALDQLFGDQGCGFVVVFNAKDFLARICHAAMHPKAYAVAAQPTYLHRRRRTIVEQNRESIFDGVNW